MALFTLFVTKCDDFEHQSLIFIYKIVQNTHLFEYLFNKNKGLKFKIVAFSDQ